MIHNLFQLLSAVFWAWYTSQVAKWTSEQFILDLPPVSVSSVIRFTVLFITHIDGSQSGENCCAKLKGLM